MLNGETLANEDKIFSMFEPHTELIKRGKQPNPIQFGHNVLVIEDAAGFVVDYCVVDNGVLDQDLVIPVMKKLQKRFVAAGPIMAALAGVGVGGTVGGITGALIGMGIPEHEAKRYEVRVKEGGILLSVHSDNADWRKRAKEILERTGAQDISVTGEGGADYVRADRPVAPKATGGETK